MERAIYVDKDRCIGCFSCVVACKLEHGLPPEPVRPPLAEPKGPDLIRVYQIGPVISGEKVFQYFQAVMCMHCADAPCVRACPQGALYKEQETGATLVRAERCIGCKFCLQVCPFGAPQFYDGRVVLCDLCIHRLAENREKGRRTACEAACPARAIYVGTPEEIAWLKGKKALAGTGFTQK
ncbi:MAG: 4Fe-4S dicluster domain-containing protein [Desulfotomaculales bacterium]